MSGMIATYENLLVRANDGLYRMRLCQAENMLDFAEKDPVGFYQMINASKALNAMIPPEVDQRWHEMNDGALVGGDTSKASRPVINAPKESVP